jgi:adenine-specific DNA-methyltransferase
VAGRPGQPHTTTDGTQADYSRLVAHLQRYVARNTFDYFIHKDLGGFLRRELDFYIKNEVMQLDDIENESAPKVEQYLSKIKVMRRVAGKLITFLAQLEDFQKALWLKKKFVVETQWCVALKEVPAEFYSEIAANVAQRAEWLELYGIAPAKAKPAGGLFTEDTGLIALADDLHLPGSLMIDTSHFLSDFTARLLEKLDDLDEKTDGVLFHSENFQALNLMLKRYNEQVKCVYIDPPYNSAATQIIYKNNYLHSSWLSLMNDRLSLLRSTLCDSGIISIAIDDTEFHRLEAIVRDVFGCDNYISNIAIMHNPKGRDQEHIASSHEYTIIACKNIQNATSFRLSLGYDAIAKKFAKSDGEDRFRELPLRRSGNGANRVERPYMYYPFIYDLKTKKLDVVIQEEYDRIYVNGKFDDEFVEDLKINYQKTGFLFITPVREDGSLGRWRWGYETSKEGCSNGVLFAKIGLNPTIYQKDFADDTYLPKSFWFGEKYDASTKGTNVLKDIIGANSFDYPKSVFVVEDVVSIGCSVSGLILDCFGGSGTTGNAIINLNRLNNKELKFVLVELGDHFNNVLLPRLLKIAYSPEWKDGKPKRLPTMEEIERGPRVFKIVRLESFEDTLNNIEVKRTSAQQNLLENPAAQGPDNLREQYLLGYLLKVEAQGSPSLLNTTAFTDPTAYSLVVKRPGSDESRQTNVDLIETFNWLIGLTVQHTAAPQVLSAQFERDIEKRLRLKTRLKADSAGPYWFRTVTGLMPDGRKALVIWRKLTGNHEEDNLVLDDWFTRQGYSSRDSEFDLIFVNGGNNLENLKTPDDTWKVRLIEEDFQRLMFAGEAL